LGQLQIPSTTSVAFLLPAQTLKLSKLSDRLKTLVWAVDSAKDETEFLPAMRADFGGFAAAHVLTGFDGL
jgi:hypothetical protein